MGPCRHLVALSGRSDPVSGMSYHKGPHLSVWCHCGHQCVSVVLFLLPASRPALVTTASPLPAPAPRFGCDLNSTHPQPFFILRTPFDCILNNSCSSFAAYRPSTASSETFTTSPSTSSFRIAAPVDRLAVYSLPSPVGTLHSALSPLRIHSITFFFFSPRYCQLHSPCCEIRAITLNNVLPLR